MTETGDEWIDPVDLLRLVPFQDCSLEELGRAAALCRPLTVVAGTHLLAAGSRGHDVIVVRSGAIRVRDGADLDATLGPGDVVGEISALAGEPVSADVVAEEDSDLLIIGGEDVPTILAIPPIGRRLRAIAGARFAAEGRSAVTAASVPIVRDAPRIRGPGAGIYSRRQVAPRLVRCTVLLLLVGCVGAALVWLGAERNRTTEVTLDTALAAARESRPAHVGAVPLAGSGPQSVPAPSAPRVPVPRAQDPTPSEDAARPRDPVPPTAAPLPSETPNEAPRGAVPASATTDTATGFHPPTPGVYSYTTSGSERIDVGGAHHSYPAETYAVIRVDNTCGWTVEHRVVEEHVDRHERCSDADAVSVLADGRDVEFYGQQESVTYRCPPTTRLMWDAPEGTGSTGSCTTSDGRSRLDYEGVFVDAETVMVGDRAVDVVHLHIEFAMTGDVRGTSTTDFWLAADSGLIVREERSVDTHAKSALGDVRYQEEASFRLKSLTPQQ